MNQPKLLIYVQHLVGIGHFKRASVIGRAAVARGLNVTLITGGQAPPSIDLGAMNLIQLPPVHAMEDNFANLLAEDGSKIDDSWRVRRAEIVLKEFQRLQPDFLMIELFPFGRRQMRFELLPLLRAARDAHPRPIVVSSIRDILVGQGKPQRADEVCHCLETYFDQVLVHGDPNFVRLDTTFPRTDKIENMLTYTGYVVDQSVDLEPEHNAEEVLVSTGGGATGQRVFEAALACRSLTDLRDLTWRFLVGPRGNIQALNIQHDKVESGIIIEPARADFPKLLKNCALSISQGGYNTIVETLKAQAPSVIIPFTAGCESEQALRAGLLAKRNLIETVSEAELSPEILAQAVNSAYRIGRKESGINLSGADVTARLLVEWFGTSKRVGR